MMPPYPVLCYAGCSHPAAFKLGAVWAAGSTRELKTYSLCCIECLSAELTSARTRRATCRLAPGEDLGLVCVFEMRTDTRDRELVRREDLESVDKQKLSVGPVGSEAFEFTEGGQGASSSPRNDP